MTDNEAVEAPTGPQRGDRARCRFCGCQIYLRHKASGGGDEDHWDNVVATEWPCVGFGSHEPEGTDFNQERN